MSITEVMRLYDIQTQHNPPLIGSMRKVAFLAIAVRLHEAGMHVFRSSCGWYGFYCDSTASSLCRFQREAGNLRVSRPYKVPLGHVRRYGTGYILDADEHKDLEDPATVLSAPVPAWVPWQYRTIPEHCTVAEYLEEYQRPCLFHRVTFD